MFLETYAYFHTALECFWKLTRKPLEASGGELEGFECGEDLLPGPQREPHGL
jgi:hypothetical protein